MEEQYCKITGQLAENYRVDQNSISYSVRFLGKDLTLTFCKKCYGKIDFTNYWYVIRGLILNSKIPKIEREVIHWNVDKEGEYDLKKELETVYYPKTPKDKLENLISELYRMQSFDGDTVDLEEKMEGGFYSGYFKMKSEFYLYLETLENQGNLVLTRTGDFGGISHARFTYAGLINYIRLFDEGYSSNKCFIAMAFQDETLPIRTAIKNALIQTGFDSVIVDEKNIDSDRTINDEIISNLKKCKFCIADFSFHKNGVYFESGFAVGQGKPVIYTCEKGQFQNAHFDIKPLQHIIYETPDELERKLIAKIEAWIK